MKQENKIQERTFWTDYLKFKKEAIENNIINMDEIIKLFEVWTRVSV